MFKVLCVLAFSGAVLAQRNPNPCLGVTTTTTFVNDWAGCSFYFVRFAINFNGSIHLIYVTLICVTKIWNLQLLQWCNAEQAVPTTPCNTGFGFDEVAQVCNQASSTCDPCPATGFLAVSSITKFSKLSSQSLLICEGWRWDWCNLQTILLLQRRSACTWSSWTMWSRNPL